MRLFAGGGLVVDGGRHAWVRVVLRDVDAYANHLFDRRSIRKVALHESPFTLSVVENRRAPADDIAIDVEMDSRLVGASRTGRSCRHKNASLWRDLETEHGRRVQIGEEHKDVVLLLRPSQILDQSRTPRSELLEPIQLLRDRKSVVEDPGTGLVEGLDVAGLSISESPDRDAADPVGAFGVFVFPGDRIAGTRREHIHVVLGRETLGDEPAVMFGPSADLRTVAMDDEGDLQERGSTNCGSKRPARTRDVHGSDARWLRD